MIFKHAKVPLAIPGTGDLGFDEDFLSQVNFNPTVRVPETHVRTKLYFGQELQVLASVT